MTIESCYQQFGGNYEEVYARIPSKALICKFIGAFLRDPSYEELRGAMDANDREAAFRASHTLKGVCANLGLEKLRVSSGALTEVLRPETDAVPPVALHLWREVQHDYQQAVAAISAYLAEE